MYINIKLSHQKLTVCLNRSEVSFFICRALQGSL